MSSFYLQERNYKMPEFEKIISCPECETDNTIEVDFEVWCSCGNGLCNSSTVGYTSRRGQPYITVKPCDKCLQEAMNVKEEELSEDIDELKSQIKQLEKTISELEQ